MNKLLWWALPEQNQEEFPSVREAVDRKAEKLKGYFVRGEPPVRKRERGATEDFLPGR
jgi:hypothetical protein